MILRDKPRIARRNRIPPAVQCFALAAQLDAHAVGEPDPVRKAVARHRDHHRDVGAQGALDQK